MNRFERRAAKSKSNRARNLNHTVIMDALGAVAHILIDRANHDYNQTNDSLESMRFLIQQNNLQHMHYEQLLVIREQFEQSIGRKYAFDFPQGPMSMMFDIEEMLKNHNVPQNVRVICGLLDTLIGELGQRVGAIQVFQL
jgi:hypothetical protein